MCLFSCHFASQELLSPSAYSLTPSWKSWISQCVRVALLSVSVRQAQKMLWISLTSSMAE